VNNRITAITAALALMLAGYWGERAATAAGSPAPIDTNRAGSVVGTVRLEGAAPKPAHISMANDPTCAKLHPGGASAEDVVVGSNGALENVIVFVSDGLAAKSFDPPQTPATIEQKGCTYHPHVLALQANQKLKVLNEDSTTHNIHPMPQNNREWNKSQPPGMQPVEASFPREEVAIPVKCNVHPWMKSYIAVLKHPYFAVTTKDGNFDISNLPPGSYTVEAWHEKFGTLSKKVSVGTETAKIDFVFKSPTGSAR
jgi:plastocyanin